MRICKRLIAGALAAMVSISCITYMDTPVYAADEWPSGCSTVAKGDILMSYDTGTVLYEKNAYDALYPASTTKVMSALLVIENCSMDEVITFSEDAVYNNEGDGSNIARDIGEQMTVEECLYAVLLESANECTYALAEHVAGSAEAFVDMMNERAKSLGCVNTHFVTVNGLHDANHYTCAYDMALICREAYRNEMFRIITGTKAYDIPPTNKHKEYTYLRNDNSMLAYYTTNKYLYDYCTGGKPGYTPEAGFTQTEFAEKDGVTLIAVALGAGSGGQYTDCIEMFDFGFDNFQLWNISDNEEEFAGESESFFQTDATVFNSASSLVALDTTAKIILPKNVDFSLAQSKISYDTEDESIAGTISYTYAGKDVGSANIEIHTQTDATYSLPSENAAKVDESEIHVNIYKVVFGVILLIVLVIAGIGIRYVQKNYYIIKNRMARKRKRKARRKASSPSRANISFNKKRRR